ncbi:Rare lipoprotein A [Rhabdaerophilaceae bacterium]
MSAIQITCSRLVQLLLLGTALSGAVPLLANAETGRASFYGRELAGQRTASGEVFRPEGLTAAHRSLAMGTQVKVTNLTNGKSVIVRVNDRGPFVRNRLIDVSYGAARALGFVAQGTTRVRLEPMGRKPTVTATSPKINSELEAIAPSNLPAAAEGLMPERAGQ